MKALVGAGIAGLLVWFFWPSPEVWTGYFYPSAIDLTNHIETGTFDSLEECRDSTVSYADVMQIPYGEYDYECGLNCEAKAEYGGLNVCEETLQ